MGVVYRAQDLSDGTVVALKVLRADWAQHPDALRRFRKEARLLAEVNNPYVTNLLEVNEDDGIHYLVMEFVAGKSLRELLDERGRLDEPEALAIMADVCRALIDAHKRGIVHRDIKPDNILLLGDERTEAQGQHSPRVKLSDFGMARHVVESESLRVTRSGVILGTPLYMSPEQSAGSAAIDPRSDVYALGATLFHLLAGRPPFTAATLLDLRDMHCHRPPPALKTLNPTVSGGVCEMVARALAKRPESRYADAEALLRDLERALRGEPTRITVHPHLPACDPGQVLHYDWSWDLQSSPEQLWPHVSNTDRLNRAVHLPAVQFTTQTDAQGRVQRIGRFRKAGLTAAWHEHPFEWVEARRFGVLREYSQGPFRWLVSTVELTPRPGGGTALTHRVRVEPKGLVGRLAAAVEVGMKGRRALDRVYRRIDAALSGRLGSAALTDPFEEPARLSRQQRRRLDQLLDRLAACGVDPSVIEQLGDFLALASPQQAARIRPLALARRLGLDPDQVVAACLHGAREGLLVLLWDILCPLCRIPSEVKDTLRALDAHGHCPACRLDFKLDLAHAVEMIFRAHPEVREVDLGTYCIGGPAHAPHVAAQVRVAPGERLELDLGLREGSYQLRGPQLPFVLDFRVSPSAAARRWELGLGRPPVPDLTPVLQTGRQVVALANDSDQELLVRVERTASREDALTAARASALALFRELFPQEVLSSGLLVSVGSMTLLVTDLDQVAQLFAEQGEARTVGLLHHHFRLLEEQIRRERGTIVKTLGEGLLAAFPEAVAAVRVGLDLPAVLESSAATRTLRLRVGVHRGPVMMATVNDRLDYLGTTVRHAMQLPQFARGGELILTQAVAADPQVAALVRRRALEGEILPVNLPGQVRELLHRFRCSRQE
jgi:serine/threonine protein kinase/class 3 adenylate cyclase